MEDVLDLYEAPYNARRPVVCFDESPKQLIAEVRTPLPMQPGRLQIYDSEYTRNRMRNLFLFCEPKGGWRHIHVTEQRTMHDFAREMQWLSDVAYPHAEVIDPKLVAVLGEFSRPVDPHTLLDVDQYLLVT